MILLALLGFGYLHRPLISTGESSSNRSSNSSSSSSSSRHLASACSGLKCLYKSGWAGQGRAEPIGSKADPPGRNRLIGYYLTALGHNPAAVQAGGTGFAAEAGNSTIKKHRE